MLDIEQAGGYKKEFWKKVWAGDIMFHRPKIPSIITYTTQYFM